jgi:hypothetical protein
MRRFSMSHTSPRWIAATALVFGVVVGGCGSSSATAIAESTAATAAPTTAPTSATTTVPTTGPIATLVETAAPQSCPSAATVGGALGITVSNPISAAGGTTSLPAGTKAVVCDYTGSSLNVIIEILSNVSPSLMSQFSAKFPVPAVSVSGVGDQALSFSQSLSGGKDNEGVVAVKGSTLVDITATGTPASLSQLEALVSQLL